MLTFLTAGRAVLLTEEATDAGVTRTTVLLDGPSVYPGCVADSPPGAEAAVSLVTRITSAKSTWDKKQQHFGTALLKSPFKNKPLNESFAAQILASFDTCK